MFFNYDTATKAVEAFLPAVEPKLLQSAPNISLLADIKNRIYGVEVKHLMPFSLYFHLDELYGKPLADLINKSTITFRILTKGSHKIVVEKTMPAYEIFSEACSDLIIYVNSEEAGLLKQETYALDLSLQSNLEFYKLFSEADSLLVVR